MMEYDVVVYGATPGGISSAIAAAREGVRVLLLEPCHHVGGLSTSGLNTAESEHMLKWTIGGMALEFYERMGKEYGQEGPAYYFESALAERTYLSMIAEAGVHLSLDAELESVCAEGGAIRSFTLRDGREIRAAVFVDGSYEGDLMAGAGVSYAVGREARAEFDEEADGIRFDKVTRLARTVDADRKLLPGLSGWARDFREGDAHPMVMNYNFRVTVSNDAATRVPFPAPERYDVGRFQLLHNWFSASAEQGTPLCLKDVLDFYRRPNGRFELNNKQSAIISLGVFGAQAAWPDATPREREVLYRDHMDYTLGLIHFLANDPVVPVSLRAEMNAWGLHKDEFVDNGNLPYQLYVREACRMRGETVVTQHDVQRTRRKEDSIGISSHFIDCHHVQRLAVSENEFVNEGRIWRMGYAYQIPYRSLTPLRWECRNLLVPVAASFTHVAFCTLRLESVWMITGQSAGVAAAMAAKHGVPVQALDVAQLQARLREAGQVIDFLPGELEKCKELNGPPEF
jgi:hypothetical protein